mgnify:FL=1
MSSEGFPLTPRDDRTLFSPRPCPPAPQRPRLIRQNAICPSAAARALHFDDDEDHNGDNFIADDYSTEGESSESVDALSPLSMF